MAVSTFAQGIQFIPKNTGEDRLKEVSGRYGNNDGICLFEDGRFLLYGYATAVFGFYKFEKDYILFYPDKKDLFELYAHHNPSLGDSTRMVFVGFQEGKTFVQFDKDSVQRVFNVDANCFDQPFIYNKNKLITHIRMLSGLEQEDLPVVYWDYPNDNSYNDFVFVYHRPKRQNEDFSGALYKTDKDQLAIQLSNYGGDRGYQKQEKDHEWNDLLLMKNQNQKSLKPQDFILANQDYGTFFLDLEDYVLNTKTNQYIRKNVNEIYPPANRYEDNRYLRKYIQQQPNAKKEEYLSQMRMAHGSIFFTSCDDVENSYHYKNDAE